jgi:hypothetical protein
LLYRFENTWTFATFNVSTGIEVRQRILTSGDRGQLIRPLFYSIAASD